MEEEAKIQRFCFISTIFYVLILASIVILLKFLSSANAADVTLAWVPKNGPEIAGYRIYYGTCSGIYTSKIDAGKVTNIKIPGLNKDHTYYFTATTYDHKGNESGFSEEAIFNPSLANTQRGRISEAVKLNI
jgi:hypothetical protein